MHLRFLKIAYIRQSSVSIVKNNVCNNRKRNHKNFENHEKAWILCYLKYKLHLPQINLVVPSIHLTLVCKRLTRNKNNSDNNAKQWTTGAWKVVQKQVHFPSGFEKLLTVVETSKNWEVKVSTPIIILTAVCIFYFFDA